MQEEILGTIYTEVSEDFQRGILPIARTIKSSKADLAIVIRCCGWGGGNSLDVKQVGNLIEESGWDNPQAGRVYDTDGLSPTINTCQGGQREPKIIVAMRGRNPDNPSDRTAGIPTEQRLELNSYGISNTLTSVQKDNMVMERASVCIGGLQEHQTQRNDGASPSLTAAMGMGGGQTPIINENDYRIRKLTPKECWRLMSFSDRDFEKAAAVNSNSQLYKQAGNSIVENCLIAIFSQLGIKGVQKWNDGLKNDWR